VEGVMLKAPKVSFEWGEPGQEFVAGGIHLIGFEFDGTACFRKGTRFGPEAIRNVVYGIEGYSPYLDLDLENVSDIYDLGNLPVGHSGDADADWKQATDAFFDLAKDKNFKKDNIRVITLGGEHSISYAPIKTYLDNFDDLVLVHLDAHADLRDGYEGHHFSHASIMRRSLDHFRKDHELIQYGIRSGTKEEYDEMKERKSLMTSREQFFNKIESIPNDRPIYLTLDLDFFDPAYMPGTGTPEAGGEDFHCFIKLMKMFRHKNIVGADITELAPELDPSNNSSVFACKVLREIMLVIGNG